MHSCGGQNAGVHDCDRGKRAFVPVRLGQRDQCRPHRAQQESRLRPVNETLGILILLGPSRRRQQGTPGIKAIGASVTLQAEA